MSSRTKKARSAGDAAQQAERSDRAGQLSHSDYNTTQAKKTRTIYDLLPVGAEYAISRRQLSQITGLPDRRLRRKIAEERKAGLLILSSTAEVGGGYFRPADIYELRRWVAMMTAHTNATLAVQKLYRFSQKLSPYHRRIDCANAVHFAESASCFLAAKAKHKLSASQRR